VKLFSPVVSAICLLSLSVVSPSASQDLPSQQMTAVQLGAGDLQQYSFFGYSIAISGDTVVIGAPGYYDPIQGYVVSGRAYVYVKPPGGWKNTLPVAELSASDPMVLGFGGSVAIANNTIFVTSVSLGGPDAAYVFVKPAGGWQNMTETAVLTDGQASDGFGSAIATDSLGETVVVGAINALISNQLRGAAYLFLKPPSGWKSTATSDAVLTASDGADNDHLGCAAAISGDTVVVGANLKPYGDNFGAAYVFVKPKSGWANMTQTAELTASKPTENAQLGTSVAISSGTIVAGAPGGSPAGSAFLYVKPADGWKNATETAHLTNGDTYNDLFGYSVVLSGDALIAGAPFANVGAVQAEGAAYLFLKPKTGWKSTSTFRASATEPFGQLNDNFGYAVAFQGATFVGGAIAAPAGGDIGAAYLFAK
jgi:hypothetical protein